MFGMYMSQSKDKKIHIDLPPTKEIGLGSMGNVWETRIWPLKLSRKIPSTFFLTKNMCAFLKTPRGKVGKIIFKQGAREM